MKLRQRGAFHRLAFAVFYGDILGLLIAAAVLTVIGTDDPVAFFL